ncbi:hypothetical protein NK718_20345 [Alsobacter sp. SYSU M60028]|uniref:Uncharacterized protein n=1 Tax=Alsobacter ponti TaxID=2962936 RepID=A0ABT1LHG4_9HYPH|nr:hypothetical protein [Alsobacter ponti]MCP8940884.1 hypothetical protein [Alsobacter ponti]
MATHRSAYRRQAMLAATILAGLMAATPLAAQSSGGGGSSGGSSSGGGGSSSSSTSTSSTSGTSGSSTLGPAAGSVSPPGTILPPASTGAQGSAPATSIGTSGNPTTSAATPGGSNAGGAVPSPGGVNPTLPPGSIAPPGNTTLQSGSAGAIVSPGRGGSTVGGVSGARQGKAAGQADICADVLAKPGNFRKQTVDECRAKTGREAAPRTAEPDHALNPVDRPSQVQKAQEAQDKGAVRSICTNCGGAPTTAKK